MPTLDPFSRNLAHFVRNMPDEALLALVRQQLDGLPGLSIPARAARGGAEGRAPGRPRAGAGSRRRATPEEREALLGRVEAFVKSGAGVSVSEVAKALSEPKLKAAAALKELKSAGRIAQGGDRRFARYAADAATAKRASESARTGGAQAGGEGGPKAAKRTKKKLRAKKAAAGAGRVARKPAAKAKKPRKPKPAPSKKPAKKRKPR